MRRAFISALLVFSLAVSARADQGWQDNQDGGNFACYDVASYSANNLISLEISSVNATPSGELVLGTPQAAGWSTTGVRVFAVDPGGSDTNLCWTDSPDATQANVAIAVAAAHATPCATLQGAAAEIPPVGAGRTFYVVVLGGNTTYSTTGDSWAAFDRAKGYAEKVIVATSTNSTAGATAFSWSTNDLIFDGARTCAGMNAAGYHPTTSATGTSMTLALAGGGSPSFAGEPAKPLYCRLRGDVATTTTADQNAVFSVVEVTGPTSIRLDRSLTFATTDTFYFEEAGALAPGGTFSSDTGTMLLGGIQATSFLSFFGAQSAVLANVSATSLGSSNAASVESSTQLFVAPFPNVGPVLFTSGASVSGAGLLAPASSIGVYGALAVANPLTLSWQGNDVVGANFTLSGGGGGSQFSQSVTIGGSVAASAVRILGTLTFNAARAQMLYLNLPSTTAQYGIVLQGQNDVAFGIGPTGGLKTIAGMNFTDGWQSRVWFNSSFVPTLTGSGGDVFWGNYLIVAGCCTAGAVYTSYTPGFYSNSEIIFPNGIQVSVTANPAVNGDVNAFPIRRANWVLNMSGTVPITSQMLIRYMYTDGTGVLPMQADSAADLFGGTGIALDNIAPLSSGMAISEGTSHIQVETGACGGAITTGGRLAYASATQAGAVTCARPALAKTVGWLISENELALAPDNEMEPVSYLYSAGTLQNTEPGLNFGSEFTYADNSGAARGDVSVNSISVTKIIGPTGGGTQCLQASNTGVITGTGTACGSGGGAVSSVSGTAQRISASPTTGAVVVDTIGGFYSGATSGGNEDLGTTLANGLVCDTTTAGVAALRTCTAGTDYQAPMTASAPIFVAANNITEEGAIVSGSSSTTAQSLGALSTGLLKGTVSAGVSTISTAVAGTDYQTPLTAGTGIHIPLAAINADLSTGVSGGQTAIGGTASGNNLTLTSNTSHDGKVAIGSTGQWYFDESAQKMIMGTTTPFSVATVQVAKSQNSANAFYFTNPNTGGSAYDAFGLCDRNDCSHAVFETNLFGSGSTFGAPYKPGFGDVELSGGTQDMGFWIIQTAGDFAWYSGTTFPNPPETMRLLHAGGLRFPSMAAPSTPPSGFGVIYIDSTSKNLAARNDAGTVDHGAQSIVSSTGISLTGLADDGTWTTQPFQAPLTACTDYVSVPCQTGSTDIGGTNGTTTVTAIESAATARGSVSFASFPAPSSSTSGHIACYDDSSAGILTCINHTSQTSNVVVPGNCSASNWVTGYGTAGARTCTQPAFTDLSGSASCAQLPAFTGGMTSSAGSCATTVASVTCAALPALTGGATTSAGSCAVTLTSSSVAAAVTKLPFSILLSMAGNIAQSAVTMNAGDPATGSFDEYPNDFAAGHIQIRANLVTNAITGGTLTFFASRNGSAIAGTGIAYTSASTTGVTVGTNLSTGSSSASDTYGLNWTTTAGYTGSFNRVTFEVVLTP